MQPIDYIRQSCDYETNPRDADKNDYIGMARAYELAVFTFTQTNLKDVRAPYGMLHPIACRVLCHDNGDLNYRKFPTVIFGGLTQNNSLETIERALLRLFESQNNISPLEFYNQFYSIYPFFEGNCRIGSLFYNLLNGTINNPIHPVTN